MLALPDGSLALGLGTLLALGASAVVLWPLLRDERSAPPAAWRGAGDPRSTSDAAGTGQATAVDALREIEFDRATGKLSDDDYAQLKSTYTRQALVELRAKDAAVDATPADADDPIEREIRRFRGAARGPICPVDGQRPEADAAFCSACGRYLAARCPHCGAECADAEQRFCAGCGGALAAGIAASAPAA